MKSKMNLQIRASLYYGFLNAAACFFFSLILYFAGKNPLGSWAWLGVWIPIVFMVAGVKAHRDIDLGGIIQYSHALATSFLVALSGAIMFCILIYLFGILAGTNITSMMVAESAEKIAKAKPDLDKELYEKAMHSLQEMELSPSYTLYRMALGEFTIRILRGFLISLIVAGFMKRDIPYSAEPDNE
jgi:hypothetical protein